MTPGPIAVAWGPPIVNMFPNPRLNVDAGSWGPRPNGATELITPGRDVMPDDPEGFGWHGRWQRSALDDGGVTLAEVPITLGRFYRVSIEVYATEIPAVGSVNLSLESFFVDSEGAFTQSSANAPPTPLVLGRRQRLTTADTGIPAIGSSVALRVSSWGNIPSGGIMEAWWTRVVVTDAGGFPNVPAPRFRDGDSPNYAWSGARGNSITLSPTAFEDPFVLHPLAAEWLDDIPPILREDPTVRAIIYAQAREAEYRQERLTQTGDELFPQRASALGLRIFEAMLDMPVGNGTDTGADLERRRDGVLGFLRAVRAAGRGADWIEVITRLVGPGWTYEEHDPDNPDRVPVDTVRILLPFPPTARNYATIRRLIETVTPANTDIVLASADGFTLDHSQLDQEGLG